MMMMMMMMMVYLSADHLAYDDVENVMTERLEDAVSFRHEALVTATPAVILEDGERDEDSLSVVYDDIRREEDQAGLNTPPQNGIFMDRNIKAFQSDSNAIENIITPE